MDPEENEEDNDELDDILDGGAEGDNEEGKGKPATPPAQDKDELRLAMAELAGTVKTLAAPKPEPRKELSQDEKDELWGVFRPEKADKDFHKKFFRLTDDMTPEQQQEFKALWDMMQQGLTRQSIVGAKNLMQIELAKLQEELAPVREYVSQAKAERTRKEFYSSFPALGEKTTDGKLRYEKIINATARTLADQEFESRDAYFKALAEGAAESIKGVLPEFDLGAKKQTKPAGTAPRLPRTRVGGTGGIGGGTQAALSVKGDATDEFLEDDN
jgi:hypothetical protein